MADKLVFSRSLYQPAAVDAAIEAYRALATFEVKLLDQEIQVTISKPDPDVADVLVDEFENHVLSETIKRSRT
jgi:hypothetical protein